MTRFLALSGFLLTVAPAGAQWALRPSTVTPVGDELPPVAYLAGVEAMSGHSLRYPFSDTFATLGLGCTDDGASRVIYLSLSERVLPFENIQSVKWRFDESRQVVVEMLQTDMKGYAAIEGGEGLRMLADTFDTLYPRMRAHNHAVVEIVSRSHGTTYFRFGLSGFSAAADRVSATCPER